MKISKEVREYAATLENAIPSKNKIEIQLLDEVIVLDATPTDIEQGMAEKSAEFKATGSEIYHQAK
jgi:phosphomethylpyrimidine synthase